ncbi:hypothetical protein DXC69_17105 [Paenibacillus polymyxa]|uniref:hypothetical protein n=1 Tax=Paenibacillus polymyxa TaxID=1406 RepID=UPI000EE45D20|nr:hypothetical protein [Paenibacillus polymyxa]RGL32847.1 hypothetical protein DXC69_17105 [Paenibacillus polymyxa]UMR34559.1 hypothetical protein MJ749_17990 [Paenibacillus polymyxa]
MDTQPKILKSGEHTNLSENTAKEYESLVQQEDEHIERLKTCTKLIWDALAIISQKASVLHMETVKEAADHLHIMELDLRRELFKVRLKKSILANKMKQTQA